MTIPQMLFSIRGRLRRRDVWVLTLVLCVAGLFIALVLLRLTDGRTTSLLANAAVAWPAIAMFAKRLHDRGKRAWPWVALYLGPAILLTILQQLELGYVWAGGIAHPMELLVGILPTALARTLPNALSMLALVTFAIGLFEIMLLPGDSGANAHGPDPRITSGR